MITKSQQEIIDSLMGEFAEINSNKNVPISSLLGIDDMLTEKQNYIDYEKETKIINSQFHKMRVQMAEDDFNEISLAMNQLEIGVSGVDLRCGVCYHIGGKCINYGFKKETATLLGRRASERFTSVFIYTDLTDSSHLINRNVEFKSLRDLASHSDFKLHLKKSMKI